MADVMLSYARLDQPTALQLADCLAADGFAVWFDRDIPPGKDYGAIIDEELRRARVVVVLWSRASASSRWVVAEASEAASKAKLVPARLDDAVIPLEFRPIQTANLVGWHGDRSSPGYRALVSAIRVGSSPVATEQGRAYGVTARPTTPGRSSHRATWLVGAALVAVVIALVFLTRSPDGPTESNGSAPTTPTANSSGPAGLFDVAFLSAPFDSSSYPLGESGGEPQEFAEEIIDELVSLASCDGSSRGEIVSITGGNPAAMVIDVSIPCADSSEALIPYSGGFRYALTAARDQPGVWTVTGMRMQVFCPRGVDQGALCRAA